MGERSVTEVDVLFLWVLFCETRLLLVCGVRCERLREAAACCVLFVLQ